MKAIFTSDWHVRSDIPVCRTDDFLEIHIKTLEQIRDLAVKNKAVIFVAGDIFDVGNPSRSQFLENMLYDIFNDIQIYFVPGNHELLSHKLENMDKSSIGVMSRFKNWHLLETEKTFPFREKNSLWNVSGFPYKQELKKIKDANIYVIHQYCEKDELPVYIENGITAPYLCNKFPKVKLFITGDNHHKFVYEDKKTKQIVFNPGCITRQAANLKNYKPSVYLYNFNGNEYEEIFLLDNKLESVDDSHLIEKKERDKRIENLINKLDNDVDMDIDFKNNIELFLGKNKISTGVKNKIWMMTEPQTNY